MSASTPASTTAALTNRLLQAIPEAARVAMQPYLEPIAMPVNYTLYRENERPRYVHFMTSGVASLVTTMAGGDAVEVGLVGNEGMPEKVHLLGPSSGMTRCFAQLAGTALRMEFNRFEGDFFNNPAIQRMVLRDVQYEALILAQLVACNRLHELEERLARWLLMVQDRVGSQEISLTQEFLGEMLGARRSTVNLTMGSLQRGGFIEFRRANIRIPDRTKLESVACECYSVIKNLFDNVYR